MKDIKTLLMKKKKKSQYGSECYKNLSEDEKQKLVAYRKKILWNERKRLIIIIKLCLFKRKCVKNF